MIICKEIRRTAFTHIFVRTTFVVLLLLTTAGEAHAQSTNKSVTDGTTPLALAPGAPAGSYALSGFDNVNFYSGSLNFRLPLVQITGRGGAQYTMALPIEQHWRVRHAYNELQETDIPEFNRWSAMRPGYGPGVLIGRQVNDHNCNGSQNFYTFSLTRLTFIAPDGTEYELRDQNTNGQTLQSQCPYYNPNGVSRGTVFVTADGTSATFVSDGTIYDYNGSTSSSQFFPSGYLMFRDGTRYRIDSGWVSWMRDRNGNKLTFNYGPVGVTSITDSLNRQVTISYADFQSVFYDQITFIGFGGAQRVIRVNYALLSTVLRSGSVQTYYQLFPELSGASPTTQFDGHVVSSVLLPDGIRQYQFKYNVYGELARVVLPTGGAYEYDFSEGLITTPPGSGSGVFNGAYYGVAMPEIYRRVLERRVYPDGVTLESKTTYSRPESMSGGVLTNLGYVVVDHLNPGGALQAREKHYYYGDALGSLFPVDSFSYSAWKDSREYRTESYNTNGTTKLRQQDNIWQQRAAVSWWTGNPDQAPPNDPRVIETDSTLADTNQVSKHTFNYDQYNNQTDVYEYDFGTGASGALVRRTHTDYITTNPVNGANYAGDTSIHMRSLPSQQQVFDAGGTERARTTYEYDNYANDANHAALVNRVGIVGMDAGFTTAYTKRGNVTRVSRFILANTGLVGSDTEFAAYSQYDIAGNVVKIKDPKGNVAQVDYSSTYQFAYPTTQTSPIPDSSGYYASNTAFTTTTAYDFWTGKITSSTDANSQTTTLEYNDTLDRLTRIVRPTGGGETTYQYGDTVGALYLRTQTKQNATTWLDDYSLFDGLGRAWRVAHYEGPSSWSAKETTFDAMGRVWKVSNPYSITGYNAATPAGAVWTTPAYDALSRILSVTTPDGSHVDTAYSGNQVTVTDQALKKRRSYTDALGRLTQVTEDPTGLAYQTYYTYDVLNNLVKVNQGAQNRYFLYDSLSRLARTRNVEQVVNSNLTTSAVGTYPGLGNTQWTMGYSYDANGNLLSRMEARNNGSGAAITTNYGYDALNRNIWANYNDGATPAVERHYDGPISNGKGRVYYNLSYNAHPVTGAAAYSYTIINSYDALGRPLNQSQQFLNSSGAWVPYTVARTYDLVGHVLTQTYPSNRSVTYSYNAAGRTGSFSGNLGDGVTRTYADTFSYNAAGQMTKERFGTTTNLYHNIHYNSRLQPVDVRLGTSASDEWNWNRGALITYYSNQARSAGNAFLEATDNNGNVTMQEHYVPTDDAISSYSITLRDTYDYDALNRITQTNGVQRTTSGTWPSIYGQGYDYDQWGNRTISQLPARTWGTAINNLAYTVNTANNRINGVTYDSAGNVTSDPNGVNTATYDGENRMKGALKGGVQSYYVYDADGKRARRVISGVETWQVYGIDGELVAEYPANGAATTPQKEYGYRSGQMLVVGGCDVVRWILADHLGTPRIEVDPSGSLSSVRRHDYLPFGEELTVGMGTGSIRTTGMGYPPAADCVRQRFDAYERDSETGLDYAQARYFSSVQGRFTSADPLFIEVKRYPYPQSWNLYAHTRNNPLKYVDPDGLDIKVTCADGKLCDETVANLNNRKGAQFKTELKDGKLAIVGKVDASKLDKSERQLYNAITDTKNTAEIEVRSSSTGIEFAQYVKPGLNIIDAADVRQLNKVDQRLSGEIIAHEALEAYAGVAEGKSTYTEAHRRANEFFGNAVITSIEAVPKGANPAFSGQATYNFRRLGVQVTYQKLFVTPQPAESLPNNWERITGNLRVIPPKK